jgi:hypothetical protein
MFEASKWQRYRFRVAVAASGSSRKAARGEIEAISTSLRDLTDLVHGRVSKSWNIDICRRLASLP